MNYRLLVLLLALAVVIGGAAAVFRKLPVPPATPRAEPTAKAASQPKPAAAQEDPAGYDAVQVKVRLPPISRYPAAWTGGRGCAHTRLSAVLGAQLGQSNGVAVFGLAPGLPADKAGLKPGDRLGQPSDCARAPESKFFPGKRERTIAWTIRRPRSAILRKQAAQEAAAHPMVVPTAFQGNSAKGTREGGAP